MKTATTVIRIILGLFLLTTGINKFLHFMAMPKMPEAANQFMQALSNTGYMMPLIAITEIVVGVMLLFNLWSALALLLLAPLSINIILFHLALAPKAIAMALFVAVLNLYLLFVHREKYKPLLSPY